MTRQRLTRDIQQLEQRLSSQSLTLQRCRVQSIAALRQTSPLCFIGLGFFSGVLVGRYGLHNVCSAGLRGVKGVSLLKTSIDQLVSHRDI